MTVAVVGLTGWDYVTTPAGEAPRRLGGTPIYAARALRAVGAEPRVITKGADLPDAIVLPSRFTFESVMVHSAEGTQQELRAVGEPFTPDEARDLLLPALTGCEWVILGGQSSTDFPPETIAVLRDAGKKVCIDGQGLARGPDPGPIRLRPFGPEAVAGAAVLKLSLGEATAVCGSTAPAALRTLGVPEVALTMGIDGATVVTADEVFPNVVRKQAFDDPTGAGDTWLAIYALERSRGQAPDGAAKAAAETVDRLYT